MLARIFKIVIRTQIVTLVVLFLSVICSQVVLAGCSYAGHATEPNCIDCINTCPCFGCDPPQPWGQCNRIVSDCIGGRCEWDEWICDCGDCGGCFTGEIGVATGLPSDQATKKIEELEPGDIVSSFNPETGEVSEGKVAEIEKTTREGYYILETESGKEVKVTAEHPFLAVKEGNYISKLKDIFSNTLTYRLITSLQNKLNGVLD